MLVNRLAILNTVSNTPNIYSFTRIPDLDTLICRELRTAAAAMEDLETRPLLTESVDLQGTDCTLTVQVELLPFGKIQKDFYFALHKAGKLEAHWVDSSVWISQHSRGSYFAFLGTVSIPYQRMSRMETVIVYGNIVRGNMWCRAMIYVPMRDY